jgi:hypothetical protein
MPKLEAFSVYDLRFVCSWGYYGTTEIKAADRKIRQKLDFWGI